MEEQEQASRRARQRSSADVIEEAIERQEQQVEEHIEAFGAEHAATLVDARRARVLLLADRSPRGGDRRSRRTSLEISERTLGAESPATLRARVNLAASYWSAGRHEEAIRIEEEVLEATERVLGLDHPDTLTARSNLSFSYASAGRADDAIEVLGRCSRPRARARRRRGGHARGALEPRTVAVAGRPPGRGDRRGGGDRLRERAHQRRGPHRDARPRAAISPRPTARPGTPTGRAALQTRSSPTSSACSASTIPRPRRRRRRSSGRRRGTPAGQPVPQNEVGRRSRRRRRRACRPRRGPGRAARRSATRGRGRSWRARQGRSSGRRGRRPPRRGRRGRRPRRCAGVSEPT